MYDEKIEALISAALADGVLTEKEKQVLFKRAQAEGIDLDEFEMVLDARLVEFRKEEKAKQKLDDDEKSGKTFVQSLKNEIKKVAIYAPTGKYGKQELDCVATAQKKGEIFLLTEPQTPSEIYEYVVYASSFDFIKYKKARAKLKVLLTESKKKYPSHVLIKQADEIIASYFRKYYWYTFLRIALPLISIAIYLGFFWLNVHWGWKILWGTLGICIPIMGSIPINMNEKYEKDIEEAFGMR